MRIGEGPGHASTWQRWTIDEIDGGVARLAIAESPYGLDPAAAEAYYTGAPVGEFRQAIVEAEIAPPEHIWGDELPVYAREDDLQRFLHRRRKARGLPDPRPLREGDVFWVLLPPDTDEALLAQLTPAEAMARADELNVAVWDVTAAARQAAKVTYESAVRVAGNEGRRSRRSRG